MLRAAIAFFVLAIVAAAFGYGGISEGAESISKILLVVFVILAVVSVIIGRRKAV